MSHIATVRLLVTIAKPPRVAWSLLSALANPNR